VVVAMLLERAAQRPRDDGGSVPPSVLPCVSKPATQSDHLNDEADGSQIASTTNEPELASLCLSIAPSPRQL